MTIVQEMKHLLLTGRVIEDRIAANLLDEYNPLRRNRGLLRRLCIAALSYPTGDDFVKLPPKMQKAVVSHVIFERLPDLCEATNYGLCMLARDILGIIADTERRVA